MIPKPLATHGYRQWLVLASLAASGLAGHPACAQAHGQLTDKAPTGSARPSRVICGYWEQMPELPGGGGMQAIAAAIKQRIVRPVNGTSQGKVFARFVVQPTGEITAIEIVRSLSDTYDQAVVDAIRQLPRLVPGQQDGRPVAVSLTVPIAFVK